MEKIEEQMYKVWARLVARSWADNEFRERLKAEPAAVLAENGISLPEGAPVRIVELTEGEVIIPLPRRPSEILSDEELAQVAAGGTGLSTIGRVETLLGSREYGYVGMGQSLFGALYGDIHPYAGIKGLT